MLFPLYFKEVIKILVKELFRQNLEGTNIKCINFTRHPTKMANLVRANLC